MNDLEPWLEWKELCALEKCSAATSEILMGFLHSRLLGYVRGLDTNFDLPKDPKYAGTLFEFKYAHGVKRSGKTYKKWIFSSGSSQNEVDFSTVAGRAARLMLNIAREVTCSKRKRHSVNEQSSEVSAGDAGDQNKYEEWTRGSMPEATFFVWLNQVAEIAAKEAVLLFDQCTERERWVLSARASGIELTDPALHSSTGLKKTALYETERKLDERVTRHMRREFPEECPEDFALLVRATIDTLVCLASENNGGTATAEGLQ
jgi:hypothetical protein